MLVVDSTAASTCEVAAGVLLLRKPFTNRLVNCVRFILAGTCQKGKALLRQLNFFDKVRPCSDACGATRFHLQFVSSDYVAKDYVSGLRSWFSSTQRQNSNMELHNYLRRDIIFLLDSPGENLNVRI